MENYFGIKPFGATPTREQLNHLKIGKKAFFHFGVNTFSEKEWGDCPYPYAWSRMWRE